MYGWIYNNLRNKQKTMKTNPTPHDYIRDRASFWIGLPALILIIAMLMSICSCTVTRQKKDPCKERRGMSGYGYGWIKCNETWKVCVLRPDGAIVYVYYEPV